MNHSEQPDDELLQIEDAFRLAWREDEPPAINEFLHRTDKSQREELLRRLVPLDIEFRAAAGAEVAFEHYRQQGGEIARVAADFFSSPDESPLLNTPTIGGGLTQPSARRGGLGKDSMSAQLSLTERSIIAGKYKLVKQIGSGGMGAVWLAQQDQPVRRQVALKLIRDNLDSRETIARFEAERQALAMMNHPNIAHVLDGGTLENGTPFFVMELVKGVPLIRYCNENRLDIRQRLELLIPVCHAIQHAHQKGIIHRDIKPSNILVSVQGNETVPKVIDFGLAKALEHRNRLTDQTMYTEHGRVVGTLQYMSPEQAGSNELDVDARTDIFSLGVVLYQLLTGSTPLDRETVANNSLLQIIEIICTREFERPSVRLQRSPSKLLIVSKQLRTDPAKLIPALRGELDWIAMKAQEKDRIMRYQTASSLADDLTRFLNYEPIAARPPSTLYLLRKFVRKHRGLVASALLTTALLVVGICTSTYFAITASNNRDLAESHKIRADNQLDVYKNSFASTDPSRGGKDMSAVDVLNNAIENLDRLEDDPIGKAGMLHEIGKSLRGLSQNERAMEILQQAFELRKQELGMSNLDTLESYSQLAICYSRDDPEKTLQIFRKIDSCKSEMFAEGSPELLESKHQLGTAYFVAYKELKKQDDIRPDWIDEALKIMDANYRDKVRILGFDHESTLKTLTNLANVHLKRDNVEKSIELGEHAIEQWQRKVQNADSSEFQTIAQNHLFISMNNFAEALDKAGRTEEGIQVFSDVLSQKASVLGVGHFSWQTSLRLLLESLLKAKKYDQARTCFVAALEEVESSTNNFDKAKTKLKLADLKDKVIKKANVDQNFQPVGSD